MFLEMKVDTIRVDIYVTGDEPTIRTWLQRYVLRGLCVTVRHTSYIYTHGSESGFVIGLINYPRYSLPYSVLIEHARNIAEGLINATGMGSATIVADKESIFVTRRKQDNINEEATNDK